MYLSFVSGVRVCVWCYLIERVCLTLCWYVLVSLLNPRVAVPATCRAHTRTRDLVSRAITVRVARVGPEVSGCGGGGRHRVRDRAAGGLLVPPSVV